MKPILLIWMICLPSPPSVSSPIEGGVALLALSVIMHRGQCFKMQALPAWMTTVLLALLLTVISYKLLIRGFITWHKESEVVHQQDSDVYELLLDHQIATPDARTGTVVC